MSTQIKEYFNKDNIQSKLKELLGARAPQFATTILQICNGNEQLKEAEPQSVFNAACLAATMNLPINPNLGYAYILPYKDNRANKVLAQFQVGYKGFIQLAQRSGRFKLINATDVKDGELIRYDRHTGELEFDFIQNISERSKAKTVGYVSYFRLDNGFENSLYMPIEDVEIHAKKYSQTYKKGFGKWSDDFDKMALKTVLKLNLSKNAPLSIDLEKAIIADQSHIANVDTMEIDYIDNAPEQLSDEILSEIESTILKCETAEDLNEYVNICEYADSPQVQYLIKTRKATLNKATKQ